MRTVLQTVRRISNEILDVKGLRSNKTRPSACCHLTLPMVLTHLLVWRLITVGKKTFKWLYIGALFDSMNVVNHDQSHRKDQSEQRKLTPGANQNSAPKQAKLRKARENEREKRAGKRGWVSCAWPVFDRWIDIALCSYVKRVSLHPEV